MLTISAVLCLFLVWFFLVICLIAWTDISYANEQYISNLTGWRCRMILLFISVPTLLMAFIPPYIPGTTFRDVLVSLIKGLIEGKMG